MTSQTAQWNHHSTGRLVLDHVHATDVDDWHRIHADPRVWVASWRVAEKVGLMRIWVGADEGNPDPAAVGLMYADRPDLEH